VPSFKISPQSEIFFDLTAGLRLFAIFMPKIVRFGGSLTYL